MFSVTFQKTANPNIIYQEEHEMKKLLALTLAAVMTLALLAGCGGKDGGSTPSSNPGGTPSDSGSNGGSDEVTDITLKVWCPSNQIDTGIMAEQQKAFAVSYTHLTLPTNSLV